MKYILLIIFVSLSFRGKATNTYQVQWSTANETGIEEYMVLQSLDSINWQTLTTVQPAGTIYTYTLPLVTAYYRIASIYSSSVYYTPVKKITIDTVTIINVTTVKCTTKSCNYTDKFSWMTTNETNVNEYIVYRGTAPLAYVLAKGSGTYTYSYYRKGKANATYYVQAIYKDNTYGNIIKSN